MEKAEWDADKAAVFVLCGAKIKHPVKRLPSIFIRLACALVTSALNIACVAFCSPRGSVLVGVRVVSGIEVNEVHPPFFLCKMKATSLRGGLPPCVLAARRHLRRPFTAEHRGR